LVGTLTNVSSPSTSGLPSEVCRTPLLIVVEPLTPASDAVQVLDAEVAVKTSWPERLMFWMVAVLVTDPPAPSVPWVFTWMAPLLQMMAGPYWTMASATLAICGLLDASGASVTIGAGPRTPGGPPNRLTLAKYP
jgi:hypothetical protein